MTCAEQQRRLSAYVDAQLPPAEREALDVHLAACAGCREALTTLQTMLQSLKTLAIEHAPDVWPAVRAQLKATPQAAPQAAPRPARVASPWLHNWPLHGAALMMGAVLIAVVVGVPKRAQPARRLQTAQLASRASGVAAERAVAPTRAKTAVVPVTVANIHEPLGARDAAAPVMLARQVALASAPRIEGAVAGGFVGGGFIAAGSSSFAGSLSASDIVASSGPALVGARSIAQLASGQSDGMDVERALASTRASYKDTQLAGHASSFDAMVTSVKLARNDEVSVAERDMAASSPAALSAETEVSAYASAVGVSGGAEAKLKLPTGPHVVQLEWPVTHTQATIDHLAQWLPTAGGRISAQDENHLIVHVPTSQYAGLLEVLRQHLPATVNAADALAAPVDLPANQDLTVDLLLHQIE